MEADLVRAINPTTIISPGGESQDIPLGAVMFVEEIVPEELDDRIHVKLKRRRNSEWHLEDWLLVNKDWEVGGHSLLGRS